MAHLVTGPPPRSPVEGGAGEALLEQLNRTGVGGDGVAGQFDREFWAVLDISPRCPSRPKPVMSVQA